MIKADDFLKLCKEHKISFFSGTPCSYLKPLINAVIDDSEIDYYGATNEGDAVAMVCGAHMTQRKGVVMFQNSGLGNAVNAITSLSFPFRFPFIMIVTQRGQPGGPSDEPQHELMGQITEEILTLMRIKWEYFPDNAEEMVVSLSRAIKHMEEQKPFAYVLRKGTIEKQDLKKEKSEVPIGLRECAFQENLQKKYSERATRTSALEIVLKNRKPDDLVIVTTGKAGRELYALKDDHQNFYMVGSMGCASSFALGGALCNREKRWIVIDGDAAVLMRMGNLATVGSFGPDDYLHIILDNEVNDSTGGQVTISSEVSLAAIALSCGYKKAYSTDDLSELSEILSDKEIEKGPTLIHFRIKKGSPAELGRPKIKPFEVKERMMKHLSGEY